VVGGCHEKGMWFARDQYRKITFQVIPNSFKIETQALGELPPILGEHEFPKPPELGVGGSSPEALFLRRSLTIVMNLILYSKPGCHLCEGLEEKLRAIQTIDLSLDLSLDIRDITQDAVAFEKYQSEIPVLYIQQADGNLIELPRQSPRSSIAQITKMLQTYL
jgi:Glutaredoxin-like domain (DUF836)